MKKYKLFNNIILHIYSEISIIEETKNIIGNYKENYSILYIKIYEQDFQKCIINVEGNVTGL